MFIRFISSSPSNSRNLSFEAESGTAAAAFSSTIEDEGDPPPPNGNTTNNNSTNNNNNNSNLKIRLIEIVEDPSDCTVEDIQEIVEAITKVPSESQNISVFSSGKPIISSSSSSSLLSSFGVEKTIPNSNQNSEEAINSATIQIIDTSTVSEDEINEIMRTNSNQSCDTTNNNNNDSNNSNDEEKNEEEDAPS